ncbi:FAD-dependent oxidoreductase [Nocardia transvalensis]|uniref:FAD-dependent monooxygenase n=1 Tax=Nocardia transvalensis TaxID=37333 RepID=UPI0018936385|nr:NAD(P)/FAD-dependent oxidoreductase [Nocardia transvalensis]MBF6327250.1 FAD-dependent monooxygenase [Nocardia transvalensis]
MRKAIVLGTGIGGLTAAIALRDAGLDVDVYGARDRTANYGITLAANGVAALRALGIDPACGETLESYRFNSFRGRTLKELPFGEVHARLGVSGLLTSRDDLRDVLRDSADGIPSTDGAVATGFTTDSASVTVEFADGRRAHGDILVGADGIDSVVRRRLTGPEEPRDAGYICWLAIVSGFDHPRLGSGAAYHYLGAGQRFGINRLGGGRVYWWGTKDMPAEISRNWSGGKDIIRHAYEGWADEVQQVIRATPEESIAVVPMQDRPFLEHWGSGPVTLLGDAAHPMLTNAGQGASITIEDAVTLARSLATDADPIRGLREYENRRRERARRMVARSRFMSTFDQSAHPLFRVARAVGTRLVPTPMMVRGMAGMMAEAGR